MRTTELTRPRIAPETVAEIVKKRKRKQRKAKAVNVTVNVHVHVHSPKRKVRYILVPVNVKEEALKFENNRYAMKYARPVGGIPCWHRRPSTIKPEC